MPPYVPDMTLNRRDQRGDAEPPFSPTDTPQARQARRATGERAELPFTPWGLQEWIAYDPAEGDYTGSCFPMGLPRSMNTPYPFQIMQDDRHVAILFESNTWHHIIPLNAERPTDPNPQWFGHSVGRWEGDTLVVDSAGFNGHTMTIDDPKTYTRPWSNERVFTRLDSAIIEYSCEENNKSLWEGRITPWTPPWARPSSER
jgi:hypothetical protein